MAGTPALPLPALTLGIVVEAAPSHGRHRRNIAGDWTDRVHRLGMPQALALSGSGRADAAAAACRRSIVARWAALISATAR